jgi:hypothetical protein
VFVFLASLDGKVQHMGLPRPLPWGWAVDASHAELWYSQTDSSATAYIVFTHVVCVFIDLLLGRGTSMEAACTMRMSTWKSRAGQDRGAWHSKMSLLKKTWAAQAD